MSIHYFSAILIKREVLSLIRISVLSQKTVHISLIDIVISIALKSVKFHWFRFREYATEKSSDLGTV